MTSGDSERPAVERGAIERLSARFAAPATAAAAVLLAVVAVGGAYLISHTSAPPAARSTLVAAASGPAYPTPALAGALSPETGPDGMPWQWIGEDASFELTNLKRSWIAFRALSSRVPRRLEFVGAGGERLSAVIATAPKLYLVGPLREGRVLLHASSPRPAERGRSQALAVFLSTLRAMPSPTAVIPESEFWATESAGGVVFNWMRARGSIELYAPATPAASMRLSFVARSLEQPRSLTLQSGTSSYSVHVGVTAEAFTVGPFRLVGGHARVFMRPSPGPKRYGSDPRLLSVQIANLDATTAGA